MGQGTESCGGYEIDYDHYEEGLSSGTWTQRDGSSINISRMSVKHLYGAKAVAERASRRANFSSDSEMWNEWVELFQREIESRREVKQTASEQAAKPKSQPRGEKVKMVCHCGDEYEARTADIKRGWGLSCSKRCAAIRRDFGRPAGKPRSPQ